jgi:prepilin-type N-terminal cleavage/methylation domain-containing protein
MKISTDRPRGFSLIEVIIAIVAISILVTAFIPVFTIVTKGSVSSQQTATMENIAASNLDKFLTSAYSTACTNPADVTLANTTYSTNLSCTSNSPMTGGKHIVVTISCSGCSSVSLAGDAYDIQ